MITFKQFLEESQNYPLYHGTNVYSLVHIINQNKLDTGHPDPDAHWPSRTGQIVSLTRNFKFAANWAFLNSDYPVVIKFNRGKIRNNYKIIPYNYFHDKTRRVDSKRWDDGSYGGNARQKALYGVIDLNQYEEVLVKPLTNVLQYIDTIYLNRNSDEKLAKNKAVYNKISKFIEVRKNL